MENGAPIVSNPNSAAATPVPSSAERHAIASPVSHSKGDGRPRGMAHKIDKEVARLAILAAWPSWAAQNLSGRAAKDNDAHVFLRSLRGEHPELFTFRCSLSPHEIAFSWLLKDGCIAY
jgi:hypothetical protein